MIGTVTGMVSTLADGRPEGSTPGRRSDATRHRRQILDAALDLLIRNPEAGMNEVARGGGVARSTVYAHFPTRDHLLRAIFDDAFERAAASIEGMALEEGSATDALGRLVVATHDLGVRYRLVASSVLAVVGIEEFRAARAAAVRPIIRLVERGQEAGEFTSPLPAAWLAVAFDGIFFSWEIARREDLVGDGCAVGLLQQTFAALVGATLPPLPPPPPLLPPPATDA